MNESSPEPAMIWGSIRTYAVRIVIGTVLVAAVFGAILVWTPYQHEQWIARKIEAIGGEVDWNYTGPTWVPQSIRVRLPIWRSFERVTLRKPPPPNLFSELRQITRLKHLHLYGQGVGDAGLDHLETLTQLETLIILDKKVTNAGLEHVTGLKSLKTLYLVNTQITDEGLERLKGLTNLTALNLNNAKTTAEGRANLQIALPNCKILPEEQPGADIKKRKVLHFGDRHSP